MRAIPSVERLLQALGPAGLDGLPRPAVAAVVRRELTGLRAAANGQDLPAFDTILARVRGALDNLRRARLQPVVNGTGVLVHTNLGRAPLAPTAVGALAALAAGYSNLEYDLGPGERGSRAGYLERNLAQLCHAEAATVVNNCAAALVLILRHFTRGARRKEVLISRGELVQIGGGFRIPDVLAASGATLREVGTTNHTGVADYAAALGPGTALILKVHRSNFYQGGFTAAPAAGGLAALARTARVPFAEDLGSGALVPTERQVAGLAHERTPVEAVRDGVDVVCFSGDKLLGGPQAGLIAGKAKTVAALRREPFFRALRCDKLVLGALQATVDLYLAGCEGEIPVLAMLRTPTAELRRRAEQIIATLGKEELPWRLTVTDSRAQTGGGTMPRSSVASVALEFDSTMGGSGQLTANGLAARLRAGTPPVIGYVVRGRLRLDLRTVFPHQDETLVAALRTASAG